MISVNRRTALAVVALAGAAGLGFAASGVAAGPSAKHTVTIEATSYKPETMTVKKGESVTWVNKDPFPHTVTAAGKFDSKSIAANGKWTYKATKAGEFAYICTLHPNMKGTIKVE
jgi:plastocyanin